MNFFEQNKEIPNQSLGVINGHSLFIKREDLLHPNVSGNKFRKLKYIFEEIVCQKIPVVATFGGAFSPASTLAPTSKPTGAMMYDLTPSS